MPSLIILFCTFIGGTKAVAEESPFDNITLFEGDEFNIVLLKKRK